ncbi:hypothetical protein [Mycobacteroides franklinii]|uniref:hypothetical protein n=1 Tax=Mycobacteroides franklinii TaxID=948102 RepID=UPI000993CF4D|nr:hypothetical protein [Mycobacteroides franklinii]
MSTVDPIEARRQRELRRRGSTGSAATYVFALVAVFLGGAVEARAIYGFAEFSDNGEPPWAIFLMPIGLVLILFGIFTCIGAARRYTGRLLALPVISPAPVLFAGAAVGGWLGYACAPSTGTWGAIAPIIFTVLATVTLVAGTRARLRARSRRGDLATVLTIGRVVPGVISQIAEIDASSGGLIGPVTVKFSDHTGVDRWVTKTGQWRRDDLPKNGSAAAVLYDPSNPGNTDRIWVGPPGADSAAAFSLWHR